MREEIAYYISSLSAKTRAKEFNMRIRNHWGTENILHYVKDKTFMENGCKIRTGNGVKNMTYKNIIRYLESFINYEKTPLCPYKRTLKLKRMRGFLNSIGNPQDSLKCIHIAGSKGKGSTCAFIAYILREAGFDVGLYTSPHLLDFRERIRILIQDAKRKTQDAKDFEGMIPKSDLVRLVDRLKPAINRYNKNSQYGPLSFFEIYTALAFVYFKQKKVNFVVLETGLGGRLDATNVVTPLVCAITPISYEHTRQLGSTLTEIAGEKTGIVKAQSVKHKAQELIVISAPQEKEAMDVIRDKCRQRGAKLYMVGKDIIYRKTKNNFEVKQSYQYISINQSKKSPLTLPFSKGGKWGNFRVKGHSAGYSGLRIRLLGEHQLINASVAIGVINAMRLHGVHISVDSLRKGLYNTFWPGRCEVVSQKPLIVLDGAQNIASSAALKNTIKEKFKYKRLILVMGVSNDKDIKGICSQLCGLADEIILSKADNPRGADVNMIENIIISQLSAVRCEINKTKNIKQAVGLARQKAKKEDLILITGSLFVAGEAREILYG